MQTSNPTPAPTRRALSLQPRTQTIFVVAYVALMVASLAAALLIAATLKELTC